MPKDETPSRSELDRLASQLYDEIRGLENREEALRRIRLAFGRVMGLQVLTLQDLMYLVKKSRSYLERLATAQKNTGILCLPQQIPGLKHRYLRYEVQRWLRSGIPQIAQPGRDRDA